MEHTQTVTGRETGKKDISDAHHTRNGIWKIIWNRRSVRSYKPDKVPRDLIEFILSAGRMAPSAMNLQPWFFSVAEGKENIRYFSEAVRRGMISGLFHTPVKQLGRTLAAALHYPIRQTMLADKDVIFHGAPVVIFIAADADNPWAELDTGMCAQNMLLAAESVGLSSCPIGLARYLSYSRAIKKLALPEKHQLQLAITLGYGNEHPETPARRDDQVHYVEWVKPTDTH